ncbi:MAG: photosystem reaction center subunit H, partial [Nocardioidaceae bacterium]|nr:photosystem reaction center subunit H [Nocardioidaceae bacterium]
MLSQDQVQQAVGADAYGPDGEKIGKVGQIFL